MRLGFLGLGLMGGGFVCRLRDLGHDVVGFDPNGARRGIVEKAGVETAVSPAAAAAGADIVMACVTTTDNLETALFGPAGAAEGMAVGTVLVDFSTTVVARTKLMASRLRDAAGAGWVDAPVSGGPPAARSGDLAIMVGGDDEDVAAVDPVLQGLGSSVVHLGPSGPDRLPRWSTRSAC